MLLIRAFDMQNQNLNQA